MARDPSGPLHIEYLLDSGYVIRRVHTLSYTGGGLPAGTWLRLRYTDLYVC